MAQLFKKFYYGTIETFLKGKENNALVEGALYFITGEKGEKYIFKANSENTFDRIAGGLTITETVPEVKEEGMVYFIKDVDGNGNSAIGVYESGEDGVSTFMPIAPSVEKIDQHFEKIEETLEKKVDSILISTKNGVAEQEVVVKDGKATIEMGALNLYFKDQYVRSFAPGMGGQGKSADGKYVGAFALNFNEGNGITLDLITNTGLPTIKSSVKVKEGDKILSATENGLSATMGVSIEEQEVDGTKKSFFVLKGIDDQEIDKVEISTLVADGMVDSAEIVTEGEGYSKENGPYLKIVWNTVSGKGETWIPLKSLVDVYTAGDGIDVTGNVISVTYGSMRTKTEDYVDGVAKVSDVQQYLDENVIMWEELV